jgi:hypothetical protein
MARSNSAFDILQHSFGIYEYVLQPYTASPAVTQWRLYKNGSGAGLAPQINTATFSPLAGV